MTRDKVILNELNVLKGIAIIGVVIFHMYPPLLKDNAYFWGYFRNIILRINMPAFMFVSGFLYGLSGRELLSKSEYYVFVRNKFKRLMVPYITVSLMIISIKYVVGQFVILKNPVGENPWKYMIFHPEGGFATFLWFIYVLFIIFMAFPIIKKYVRNSHVLFLLILIIYFVPLPRFVYFNLDLVRTFLIYFYIGYLYSTIRNHRINSHPKYLCLLSTTLFGILYIKQPLLGGWVDGFIIHRLTDLLFGILGMISLYYVSLILSKTKNPFFSIFNYLGTYAAVIYLLHTIPMGFVRVCMQQYLDLPGKLTPLIAGIMFLSGTLVPILFTKYVLENNRIISLLIIGVNKNRNTS